MRALRRLSGRAWFLHAYLIAALFLMGPVPPVNSYWTDADNNGQKEWVEDPPPENTGWWDADSDGDNLSNADEVLFGSDPYRIDEDFDGLTDLVEKNYANPVDPLNPWSWDSDGDGYSDHDEYYQYIQGYTPVVWYPSLGGNFHSYYDADGDGIHNQNDSDPTNMDRDGDGILNWNDSYPDDPNNGMGGGGGDPPADSDNDGIPDSSDPFPWGSYWYQNVEYGGLWADADNDSIPDPADPTPNGGYWYGGVEYPGTYSDQDGDGIPDPADPWPTIPWSFTYNGMLYPGSWNDSDNDGVPDPADTFPYGSYTYNNVEYGGMWSDQDNDGIPDPADPWPSVAGSYQYNGTSYPGMWADQDNDGIPDPADTFPTTQGSYWWNGTEYAGAMPDADSDGKPDFADDFPNGSYWYQGTEYAGTWVDTDSDGIPNPADSTPDGSFWYNGMEYPGSWMDTDGDLIPDPADSFPNGSYWWQGQEYAGTWEDSDLDNVPNAFDSWPYSKWNGEPYFEYNGVEYGGYITDDRDGDTIPDPADQWPDDFENNADDDLDGLSNYAERTEFHTLPDDVDSDDDFLSDREELYVFYTDPMMSISHPEEGQVLVDGYLHLGADTDGDGLPDLLELFYGFNEMDPADGAGDADGDGYTNVQAYQFGWSLTAHAGALDQDLDGIPDAIEDFWSSRYPGIMASSQPGDAVEDADEDGLMNFEEIRLGLDPGSAHSRVNVVTDLQEMVWRGFPASGSIYGLSGDIPTSWQVTTDADHSGAVDGLEAFAAALAVDPNLLQLPLRQAAGDYDGDGMPDAWEYHPDRRSHFNLRDAQDATGNFDGDQATNLKEYEWNRDPLVQDDPVLEITPPNLPGGKAEMAYSAQIQATGGTAPYTFSVSSGSLPGGYSLDSNTGLLSGMTTETGSFSFTVTVMDDRSYAGERAFSLDVVPKDDEPPPQPVVITTTDIQMAGLVGEPFSVTFAATGGRSSTYSFDAVFTPPSGTTFGLSADHKTISGTSSGPVSFPVTVTVWDQSDSTLTSTKELQLTISDPLVITTDSLPDVKLSYAFTEALSVTGGQGQITFAKTGGSLPPGVSLSPTGTLAGTPATEGTYSFTVRASDTLGRVASKTLSIVVYPPPPPLAMQGGEWPTGVCGAMYSAGAVATGGSGSYTFSGGGPSWMTVNQDGSVRGTPTIPGSYVVSMSVMDGDGNSASADYSFEVKVPTVAVSGDQQIVALGQPVMVGASLDPPLAGQTITVGSESATTDASGSVMMQINGLPEGTHHLAVTAMNGMATATVTVAVVAGVVPPGAATIDGGGLGFVPAAPNPASSPSPIVDALVEYRGLGISSNSLSTSSSAIYRDWVNNELAVVGESHGTAEKSGTKWTSTDGSHVQQNDSPPPSLDELDWSPGVSGRAWLFVAPAGNVGEVAGFGSELGPAPAKYAHAVIGTSGHVQGGREESFFQVRLKRDPADVGKAEVKKTFLEIHTVDDGHGGLTQTVVVRPLTLIANAMNSETLTVMAGQNRESVYLVPVEVVDANKAAVSKLKVAKMSDTGVLSGAEVSATLDIDKDPDRFFIRVPGGVAMGGISVKVSTADNPDSTYNDNPTQIDLQADGGDAISKSMLLVSDETDDIHQVDGVADDATDDRTHKIQLGGNLKIEAIKIGTGGWQTMDGKTPVPVEKTVTLGVIILRRAVGGSPVIMQTLVEGDLKRANERYAQAGIKLNWSIRTEDPPHGVDLSDGLTEFTVPGIPSAEESALLTSSLTTPSTDDLQIFYVNHFSPAPGSYGEAFRESAWGAPLAGNMILSSTRGPFTMAHELGHMLKDYGGHSINIFHMMRGGGTSTVNSLGASKRITNSEETTMKGSKHAK